MARFEGKKIREIAAPLHVAPKEVEEFCEKEKILGFLDEAVKIVEMFFPEPSDFRFELEQDPENPDDEWVAIHFSTRGEVDEIVEAFNQYTHEWVKIPWPERNKILLAYSIE